MLKYLLFMTLSLFGFAQNTKLKGKIIANTADLSNIPIYNMTKNTAVVSSVDGSFEIEADIGDLLTFQAVHLDYWRQTVKNSDFETGMTVKMTVKTTELEEIEIVEYPNINAKDLGIINYTPKKYTVAERRLRPSQFLAKDVVPFMGAGFQSGIAGVAVPIDPLLYWINGQTKKLKENLKIERKIQFVEDFLLIFDSSYFTDELKINPEDIEGFAYYLAEDENFIKTYQTKHPTALKWELTNHATTYNNLIYEK